MSPPTSKPLPPGRSGIPLLGETLSFAKNSFGFVAERAARNGPIFRTRVFGRDAVVLVGPDGSGEFIDEADVERSGGMLPHIQELFGGRSLPTLDGEAHRQRRTFVLEAFSRAALTSYLPILQRRVEEAARRWSGGGEERRLLDEYKRLSIEVICETIMGLSPGPIVAQLQRDYDLIIAGFGSLPVPLPGTSYTKARKALERILGVFERVIADHQARPADDGLSRILGHRTPDGKAITAGECKLELHHFVIAGLIVFGELVAITLELARNEEVLRRLKEEIAAQAHEGPLALEQLYRMDYLNRFTMEVKRLTPIVPVIFGRAKRTFEWKGCTVPEGWMVLWAPRASHQASDIYPDPERFDPERYATGRAEHQRHPHAFVPQGAGPITGHRCAGLDFTTYLMQVFTIVVLRGYRIQLSPGQALDYDWSRITPEPRDGLRARVLAGV